MNHFLVSVLGVLNGVFAITIILFWTFLGGYGFSVNQAFDLDQATQLPPFDLDGGVLGAVLGLGIAAVVCGLLAIAISIEKSLKNIATKMEEQ